MCDRVSLSLPREATVQYQSISGLLFHPPHAFSRLLSIFQPPLMCFHENCETEQVGVVAPGVGTKQTWSSAGWFLLSVSLQPKHCKARLTFCSHVALHRWVQNQFEHTFTITNKSAFSLVCYKKSVRFKCLLCCKQATVPTRDLISLGNVWDFKESGCSVQG